MPAINYSEVLRVIGQDLEIRGIKAFDIRDEGEKILVQCGYQMPPAATPVTLTYTPKDIRELRPQGEEKRGQPLERKDFFTLSQTLRTIGGYVDQQKARLIRLSNNEFPGADVVFRIEYETREGERLVDNRSGSAIYDLCVNMYKRRGKLARGIWRP
ncbi:MAG TPA: hypothetical protein VLD83_09705 [Candidatus Binatia bacterium]|nr:hypothetical protein [Candidatus Binatia bacterium]